MIQFIDNPRKIKQVLNRVFYIIRYSSISTKENKTEYLSMVIIWSVITIVFPELSKIIVSNPRIIKNLLQIVADFTDYDQFYNEFKPYKDNRALSNTYNSYSGRTKECLLVIMNKSKVFDFFQSVNVFFGIEAEVNFRWSKRSPTDKLRNPEHDRIKLRNETIESRFNESMLEMVIIESGSL